MMAKNTEIELKLVVSKENLKKMLGLDFVQEAIRQDSKKKRKLISSYYDTEDLAFKAQGIAYRVRDKGDGTFEATVKTSRRNSAGLSERLELNIPLSEDKAVLEGFLDLGLEQDLVDLAPNGVVQLFKVSVERTTYILDLDGAVAEQAIDNGRITAGKAKDKIDEIEIELLEGDKGVLLDFAARLAAVVPMFVEKRSKFVRGLALRGIETKEETLRSRISGDGCREGFMAAIQKHCDMLLDGQKALLAEELDEEWIKALKKELYFLRSLLACVETATDKILAESAAAELEMWRQQVERCLTLSELEELWDELQSGSKLLEKNSLDGKLSTVYAGALEKLVQMAQAGSMTTLVFGIISWLYSSSWKDEATMTAQSMAVECLDKWQASKKKAETAEEKLFHVENMLFLAKSISGKGFSREAELLKKARRKLAERVGVQRKEQLMAELMSGSSSKNLYRDCGVVLGYLLNKKINLKD